MESTKHAIFILGEEKYGLNIMDVNTIEKFITINPVENAPKNVKGLIHLRGNKIPVYSLRRKFGLQEIEPDEDTRFIITFSNELQIAYEVDKMIEIAQIGQEQMNEVPSIIRSKDTAYIKLVSNMDGSLVILLDQNGILTEEERSMIKAIIKQEE